MSLFNGITFEKENITVLGADKDSAFVTELAEYISKNGNGEEKSITAPDIMNGKYFSLHSKEEIADFKEKSFIIGIVSAEVFEKKICDVIKNYEEFSLILNISSDELVYPFAIAKAILEREAYNLLYINDVNTVSKRFLARELAKNIRNGIGIRIINTDSGDVEILCR